MKTGMRSYTISNYDLQIFLLCFCRVISGYSSDYSKGCQSPGYAIEVPRNALPIAIGNTYRWRVGYRVRYECEPGYRYQDGTRQKTSHCIQIDNRAQWHPIRFSDCLRFCPGKCQNGGKCTFDKEVESFRCECPQNYIGDICEKSVCHKVPYVRNHEKVNLVDGVRSKYNGKYGLNSIISYTCKPGYQIEGTNVLHCTESGSFKPHPPKCIPNAETRLSKCYNEYKDAKTYTGHLLQEGNYRKHADYTPGKTVYNTAETVQFTCPSDSYIEGTNFETTFSVFCKDQSEWSAQWPICKQRRCAKPLIKNGGISSVNMYSYPVGAKISISCSRRHYLWLQGTSSTLTCTESEEWNTKIPECISLNVYRNRCLLEGSKFKLFPDDEGYENVPGCIETQNSKDQENSEINTITIVTASAAAVFGFLLLIVLIVAFHRRHLLRRIRRVEQESADGSNQYGGGSPLEATLHFLLPSYDEAVRSKPTTDPPTFADVMQEETERLHSAMPEESIMADNRDAEPNNDETRDNRNTIFIEAPLLERQEQDTVEVNSSVEIPPPYPGNLLGRIEANESMENSDINFLGSVGNSSNTAVYM